MRPAKPLWGFGWAGWCLLPVAVALAWAYFSGYDLRHEMLRLITDRFGIRPVFWIVTRPLVHQNFGLTQPGLGLWSMVYVLLAMRLYPGRLWAGWWAIMPVWAVCRAEVFYWLMAGSGNAAFGPILTGLGISLAPQLRALAYCLAIDLVLLGGLTRSWAVAGTAMVISLVSIVIWSNATTPAHILAASVAWHAVAAGALLWWAIRARMNLPRPHECQACRYDLRGSAGTVCPECGWSPAMTPAGAPASTLGP
jgi:hypothetical protein